MTRSALSNVMSRKGFGTTVAINAAIGAATGAAGAFAGPARVASTGARMLIKGAIGGTASVLTKAAERGTENLFYGTHHNLFEGAAKSFLTGFAVGAIFGASGGKPTNNSPNKLVGINKFEGNFKLRDFTGIRKILEPKPTNPVSAVSRIVLNVRFVLILPSVDGLDEGDTQGWGQGRCKASRKGGLLGGQRNGLSVTNAWRASGSYITDIIESCCCTSSKTEPGSISHCSKDNSSTTS